MSKTIAIICDVNSWHSQRIIRNEGDKSMLSHWCDSQNGNTSTGEKNRNCADASLVALKNNMASVSLGNVEKKRKKYGQKCCAVAKCNNQSDARPDLSCHAFPKDLTTRKEWELRMRRGDVYFKIVDHRFCCLENFRPTDFKAGLTGQRRDFKKVQFPLFLSGHQKR